MVDHEQQEFTRRVREGSDLPQIMQADGVKLTPNGAEFKALCPFHPDKNPSLSVFNKGDGWLWHCFGCDANGDVFEWLHRRRGLSFVEARTQLAKQLGLVAPAPRFTPSETQRRRIEEKQTAAQRGERKWTLEAMIPADDSEAPKLTAAFRYLTEQRKIDPWVLKDYHVGQTPEGDWIAFDYRWTPPGWRNARVRSEFCKLLKVKRVDGKKEENRDPRGGRSILYGMEAVSGFPKDRLVICEGEIDAMSWAGWGIPAVSIPGGAKATGWIDLCWDWLQTWKRIYISFDEDAAGRAKVVEVVTRLGIERTDIVRLPEKPIDGTVELPEGEVKRFKDANECLMAGLQAADMEQCLAKAEVLRPGKLKDPYDLEEKIWAKFHPEGRGQLGLTLPWGNAHGSSLPFRFRYGELSVWSGYNKHGKSEVLNHCMVDLAWQGELVLIVSLEVAAEETYRKLIRMTQGRRDVIAKEDRDQFADKCLAPLAGKIWVYDHQGDAPLDEVLEVMTYAYQRFGVRQFVLDSLMRFRGLDGEGQQIWNAQKAFMDELLRFCQTYQTHVHLVAHSKKPDKGGDSRIPKRYDIMGSAYISNLAFNVIVVWRNKAKQEALEEVWQACGDWWRTNRPDDPQPPWKRLMGGPPTDDQTHLWPTWNAMMDALSGIDKELAELARTKLPDPDAYFLVDVQRGQDGDTVARRLWFDPDSLQFLESNAWVPGMEGSKLCRPARYVDKQIVEMEVEL